MSPTAISICYPLSVIRYPLSVICYPLSVIRYLLFVLCPKNAVRIYFTGMIVRVQQFM